MAQPLAFSAPPTQYRGLADLFPSIGKWIQGNREKINAPQRARSEQRAMGLLGEAPTSFDDIDSMQFGDVSEGSGLLADPESFANQMKYSLGLMATPGYEEAGRAHSQQAMMHQLGLAGARQDQQNWQQDQNRLLQETNRANALRRETEDRQAKSAYVTQTNAIYDDYVKAAEPYRTTAKLMQDVQNMTAQKGFSNMGIIDDVQLVKSYAKMLLPNEAVMTTDIADLTKVDISKNPELAVIRTFAAKLNGQMKLTENERIQLYDAMHRISGESYKGYEQLRGTFEEKAARGQYHVDDVRRKDMQRGGGASLVTPEMRAQYDVAPNLQPKGSTGVLMGDQNRSNATGWQDVN